MTGHSYVGSTPSVAAAHEPRGPGDDRPERRHGHRCTTTSSRPACPTSCSGPARWRPTSRSRSSATCPTATHFGKKPEETGCGLPNSSLTAGEAQLSGRYTAWHARARLARAAPPPPTSRSSWSTASTTTPPASPAWSGSPQRGGRAGDKIWLGQWDHGSGCCPTRRGIQWTYALHAWFDKPPRPARRRDRPRRRAVPVRRHVRGRPHRRPRAEILTRHASGRPRRENLTLHPAADGTLGDDGAGDARLGELHRRPDAASPTRRAPAAPTSSPRPLTRTPCSPASRAGPRRLGDRAARAPDRHALRREPGRRPAPDQPVRDQPRAAGRRRDAEARDPRRADGHAAARLRDGPPPARGPPARAAGHHLRPGQGADLRASTRR